MNQTMVYYTTLRCFNIYFLALSLSKSLCNSINLQVPRSSLLAVVGQVGVGKSSIVSAILGEMEKLHGHVTVRGSVAYVAQQAWIQNATVRDNILFGKPFDEERYNRILDACALRPDLQILPAGDVTEIGEKGINLSGGQKQRISMARAVYQDCDIYLLDDPLSAVDSHVGKHIFEQVISSETGLLRNKTRLLVTHGIQWLPVVDNIVVVVDGEISESGSYEELLSDDENFAQFLRTYLQQQETEDNEDEELQNLKSQLIQRVQSVPSEGQSTNEEDSATSNKLQRTMSEKVATRVRRRSLSSTSSIKRQRSKIEEDQTTIKVDKDKIIQEEISASGKVSFSVYWLYVKSLGVSLSCGMLIFFLLSQAASIYSNVWLSEWTSDPLLMNSTLSDTPQFANRQNLYLGVYGALNSAQGTTLKEHLHSGIMYLGHWVQLAKNINSAGGKYGGLFTVVKWIINFYSEKEDFAGVGKGVKCHWIGFGKTNRMLTERMDVRRARRPTVRGLASHLQSTDKIEKDAASTSSNESEDCHVYSKRVERVFKSLPVIPHAYPATSGLSPIGKKRKIDDTKSSAKTTDSESPVSSSQQPPAFDESFEELKDPTPPPTPKSNEKKRRRGMKRAVRKAVTRLQKVQKYLDRNDEVVVVGEELPSSQKSPAKDRTIDMKFRTRSGIIRRSMKATDRFADIMSLVAENEGVSDGDIIMFINDRTIHPYDSPQSLGVTVADIVECHVRGADSVVLDDDDDSVDDPSRIRLMLRTNDNRKCSLIIGKDEPMEKLMRQYCREMHIKYGSVRFQFDGERIDPSATPQSLELESDFCLDVLPC